MRSKLLVLAAVVLVGCSEDEPQSPSVVTDSAPETIGVDAVVDSKAPVDSTVADTGVADTRADVADTAMETATDTGVDTMVDTTVDVAPDTIVDTAVDDTLGDTSTDALDTSVADAAFPAAPTCDGTIATAEYASQYVSGGTTWHVTWDDSTLYLGLTNADVNEGAIVYIDANPVAPPAGGTDADGNLAGYTYDSTKLATLPFRANLVVYAKKTYREYRTADGAGGWSSPTTTFGCFGDSGTTRREFSIPWSALGGRPTAFGMLGYVTSGAGFVYGEFPTANPDGTTGTTATATKYFHVASTGPASTATAFADER